MNFGAHISFLSAFFLCFIFKNKELRKSDTSVKMKFKLIWKIGASVIFAMASFFWLGFSYVFAANQFGDDIGKSLEEYEPWLKKLFRRKIISSSMMGLQNIRYMSW